MSRAARSRAMEGQPRRDGTAKAGQDKRPKTPAPDADSARRDKSGRRHADERERRAGESGRGERERGDGPVRQWWADDQRLEPKGKVLGEGTFAVTELCTYREADGKALDVAVKFLRPSVLLSRWDEQDFFREAGALQKIRHPHVVQVVASGTTFNAGGLGGPPYVVQELMSLGSLKDVLLRQMQRPWKQVISHTDGLTWLMHAASGLSHLHRLRVIHRDVKPENVLLSGGPPGRRPVAKLSDFGIRALEKNPDPRLGKAGGDFASHVGAMELDPMPRLSGVFVAEASAHIPDYHLTGCTTSLLYMAPEVIKRQRYNEKADIFSLGVVIYEVVRKTLLVTLVTSTGSCRDVEKYAASIAGGYRPEIPGSWPPEIRNLIEDCWSHDPRARPTALEVGSRLKDIRDVGFPDGDVNPMCVCGPRVPNVRCGPSCGVQ